jgi:GDP-L-fucose synthase
MSVSEKIFVAGHSSMVGSVILRKLQQQGHDIFVSRAHDELDLLNLQAVNDFFEVEKPPQVYLAAARSAVSMPITPIPPTSFTTICCCS